MKTFLHYLKLSHYPISHLCLLSLLLDSETTSRCDCWEGWRGNRCDICGGKVMVEMNYKILANFLAHFGLFLDFWILCPLHYMRIFFSPWPSIFFIFLWDRDSMVFVHFQKILERTQVGFFDANIYITLLPHLIESDYFLEHIDIKVKKFFLFVVKFCLP